MKFKVGDKVRIKPCKDGDEFVRRQEENGYSPDMKAMEGKVFEINKIVEDTDSNTEKNILSYKINSWYFREHTLCPAKVTPLKFEDLLNAL